MRIIRATNINDAYFKGLKIFQTEGRASSSRVGEVLALDEPLFVEYDKPWERVLLDADRDSNPFFSIFESLWMLSGRRDATWLDRFISDFSSRFAEKGGLQHGAYGHRWREHFHRIDQLEHAVAALRKTPTDRRVVIQMWDPTADLGANTLDIPCNLTALPRITQRGLDLTIFCRSGDFIWGTAGANAVHFSVLHEYLAGRVGVPIGRMYHIVNNPHVYTGVMRRIRPPVLAHPVYPGAQPLGVDWDTWDSCLKRFMWWTDAVMADPEAIYSQPPYFPDNPWFENTALPLFAAHTAWKTGQASLALDILSNQDHLISEDWRKACVEWVERRIKRAAEKDAVKGLEGLA